MISATIPTFESELEPVLEQLGEPPAPGTLAEQQRLGLLGDAMDANLEAGGDREGMATQLAELEAHAEALNQSRQRDRDSLPFSPDLDGMGPTLGGGLSDHSRG